MHTTLDIPIILHCDVENIIVEGQLTELLVEREKRFPAFFVLIPNAPFASEIPTNLPDRRIIVVRSVEPNRTVSELRLAAGISSISANTLPMPTAMLPRQRSAAPAPALHSPFTERITADMHLPEPIVLHYLRNILVHAIRVVNLLTLIIR